MRESQLAQKDLLELLQSLIGREIEPIEALLRMLDPLLDAVSRDGAVAASAPAAADEEEDDHVLVVGHSRSVSVSCLSVQVFLVAVKERNTHAVAQNRCRMTQTGVTSHGSAKPKPKTAKF